MLTITSAIGTTNLVAPDFNPAGNKPTKSSVFHPITDNLPQNTDEPLFLRHKSPKMGYKQVKKGSTGKKGLMSTMVWRWSNKF